VKTQTAKNKSDRLFSKHVRSLGWCQNCGESDYTKLQCAHWISRRYSWTRTYSDNAFCLCAKCHRLFTDHPTEFSRWAINQRGEATYQTILERSQTRTKFDWHAELERLESL